MRSWMCLWCFLGLIIWLWLTCVSVECSTHFLSLQLPRSKPYGKWFPWLPRTCIRAMKSNPTHQLWKQRKDTFFHCSSLWSVVVLSFGNKASSLPSRLSSNYTRSRKWADSINVSNHTTPFSAYMLILVHNEHFASFASFFSPPLSFLLLFLVLKITTNWWMLFVFYENTISMNFCVIFWMFQFLVVNLQWTV